MAVASLDDISTADPDVHVEIPEQVGGRPGQQLAYKNNNPGNVEYAGQPGAQAGDDGRFAKFPTPEAGLADVHRIIGLHQDDTLEAYLSKYAPPSENDTAAYVANAAKSLGVSKDTPVSKVDRAKLAAFQVGQESSSKVTHQASLADIDDAPVVKQPLTTAPTGNQASLADIAPETPSLLERGKALLEQAKGFGSQLVDQVQKPGLGFAQPGVGNQVVGPWKDAAKDFVQEATGPLENVPGGPQLRRALHAAIDVGGDSAASALEFLTSPLGLASGVVAGTGPLASGAVRSIYSGAQAPATASQVAQAAREPTPENIARAAVSTAFTAAPMAPEIAAGAGKAVQAGTEAAGALERHNVEAARLVEEERQQGLGTESGTQILGGDMQVKMGDQTVTVHAAGGSTEGRPFYQILGADGKPIYAGFGQNVQDYLRQNGARPVNEAPQARYPAAQPTGDVGPGEAPSARATAPKATVPEEGPSDEVQRAVDARERLAQDLADKPFKDLSNSERLVVDHFVSQGYGFAVRPGEGGTASLADVEPTQTVTPIATPRVAIATPRVAAATPTAAGTSAETPPKPASNIPGNIPGTASLADIDEESPQLAQVGKPGPQLVESPAVKQERQPVVDTASLPSREPSVPLAQGEQTVISVPGEKTTYPARYAVMEASDLQASHNPQNFEPNPAYQHQNDRDYTSVENAARVVNAAQDFRPEFVLTKSPTAELGTTIVDQNGNALGGNNRAMALQRVYKSADPAKAQEYRDELVKNANQFGINPAEIDRFKEPVLVRQVAQPLAGKAASNAITDFNKSSAATLNPGEQAVADGRRLSVAAIKVITGSLDELGDEGTLSQALRGDNGQEILTKLVTDGVITEGEKNGYLDEKGQLTPEVKGRIAQALVGRMFKTPKEFQQTPPELRAKAERIAPQVLRIEGRKGWELTEPVKEALSLLTDMRTRRTGTVDDLLDQVGTGGKTVEYSPVAIQIAKKLQESPLAAARAFRMYATDESMSRKGAQTTLYQPPTQKEAFEAAFGKAGKPGAGRGANKIKAGTKREQPGATEQLGPSQSLDRPTPGFYSQLERTVDAKLPSRAPASQVLATITNPQNGVKADEIEWSGIDDWLKAKASQPVTKQEVQEFVRANATEIREVPKGEAPYSMGWTEQEPTKSGNWWKSDDGKFEIYERLPSGNVRGAKAKYELHSTDKGRGGIFPSRYKAQEYAAQIAGEETKFGQYVTPGGENYRELLLTLPPKAAKPEPGLSRTATITELMRRQRALDAEQLEESRRKADLSHRIAQIDYFQMRALEPAKQAELDSLMEQWGKINDSLNDYQRQIHAVGEELDRQRNPNRGFKSGHWEEENVLAHVRMDDRTGEDGARILHVAEIQSDWHQSGRQKGYQNGKEEPLTAEEQELRDFNGRTWTANPTPFTPEETARHADLQARVGSSLVRKVTAGKSGVANAPFKKTWPELAFKRLLRYAAEDGYDRLTWDTGETNADRYDLSHHIDTVRWHEGSGHFEAIKDGDVVMSRSDVGPEQLADLVGKDVAQKLVDQKPVPFKGGFRAKVLRHQELKVSSAGMTGFYDKILPAFANKYGKKWGAKVTDSTIQGGTPLHFSTGFNNGVDAADGFGVFEDGELQNGPVAKFPTEAEAETYVRGLAKPVTVHSIPITDQMRESVMQGQPMFQRADRPLGLFFPPRPGFGPRLASKAPTWWKQIVDDARWSTKAGPLGTTFYVNEETAQAMRTAAYEDRRFKLGEFLGLHLDSYVAHSLVAAVDKLGSEYQESEEPGVASKLDSLARSIEKATSDEKGIVIVKIREDGQKLEKVVQTLRHERIHAAQSEFGNISVMGGPSPAAAAHIDSYEAHKILQQYPKLLDALLAKGYDLERLKDTRTVITEAAAHFGAGQDLGFSIDEQVDFLDNYFHALESANPSKSAADILKRMSASVRGAYEREVQVRRSQGARPSERPRHIVEQEQASLEEPPARVASYQTDDAADQYDKERRRGELGSLFGEEAEAEIDAETERDRAQLTGAQLTAQMNAPVSRAEQLKRLRKSKDKPQTNLFEAPTEKPQKGFFDDESGSAKLSTLTLGLDKFVEQDIAPTLAEAGLTIRQGADDIIKILVPVAHGGPKTKLAALILRNNLSELARHTDRAEAALATARAFFQKMGDAQGRDFILKYFGDENAPLPKTGDKDLDGIAQVLRNLLDGRRDEVQALGKGKLAKFYTNYFPRVWKDWRKAEGVFASFYGRRPLEGGKGFLKQRKHATIQDAIDAGLEPVSWNPIDLVLLKVREMDRYVMAHTVLENWKGAGLLQYIDAREGKAPAGWMKVIDPIGTVYGPSIQQIGEYPNAGLWSGLTQVADALGVKHTRGFKPLARGSAIGLAHQGTGAVETMHGTAEDVLAHEIGHQIDWLSGSGNRFVVNYPSVESVARIREARKTLGNPGSSADARKAANQTLREMKPTIQKRKQFQAELRALADLRSGRKEYTHKREEKMALLSEMWVGARELFQKTAPMVFDEWKRFLDETPKLAALRDIQGNTEVTPIQQPYDVGGLVIRGHWWAPEGAARILNNYLSPSLRTTSGVYKAVLGANNVLNQFQLGLSAFHLGFTSADAAISKAALGYEALLRGKPLAAAKAFSGVATAPFTTMIQGNKLLREWYKPGSEGAWIAQLVDGLVAAGGRARMDAIYGTEIADKMRHAFRNGNVWGGLIRAPFAGVEAISNVMMKEIVPRQKLGVFADMARFELERLGPDATFEQTRAALAQAWDSVENRMGQMTYDNLFWNRTVKDIAMLGVRSVGWNLGTLREIGGGAIDLVRVPLQIAGGKPPGEVNLKRISYLMGLVTVSAIMGAIYQYLRTGKGPEELKDLFFPKTGQLDAAGRPDRAALPTYVKDVYHYETEPGKTLANKVAPIWSGFAEMIRNEDFYGTEIRGKDDPLVEQMKQLAEYAGRTVEPFGIRNLERDRQMQNPPIDQASRFIGITPAPAAIEKTKAERLASELSREHIPAGSRTHEEAQRRDAEQTIARLARAGKDYGTQARDYIQSGVLTSKDAHAAAIRSQVSPLLKTARSLPLEDLLDVWKVSTPDEKTELRPLLGRHLKSLKDLPIAQREQLTPRLQAALTQ